MNSKILFSLALLTLFIAIRAPPAGQFTQKDISQVGWSVVLKSRVFDSVACTTTFTYEVTVQSWEKDLSHFVLGFDTTQYEFLNLPGIWEIMTQPDPTTGVVGLKMDAGQKSPSVVDYSFTLAGEVGLVDGHYSVKGGTYYAIGDVQVPGGASSTANCEVIVGGPLVTYKISGIVFVDTNIDNIHESGEPLLSGVAIQLTLPDSSTIITLTDANGYYEFAGLSDGAYQLNVLTNQGFFNTPAASSLILQNSQLNPVINGADVPDQNFWAIQTYSISGKVWEDMNMDNIYQSGEPLLSGVNIQLTLPDASTLIATTDSNGYYIFSHLLDGAYQLNVLTSSGFFSTPAGQSLVLHHTQLNPVIADADVIDQDFWAYPTYSISGVVFEDLNQDNIWESGEPFLNNVAIQLTLPDSSTQIAYTDINGAYSFSHLLNGAYQLNLLQNVGFFSTPAGQALYLPFTQLNPVINGADVLHQDFWAYPTYKLSGIVFVDVNLNNAYDVGEPLLNNVAIQLTKPDASTVIAYTNINGYYEFTHLINGNYQLNVLNSIGFFSTSSAAPLTLAFSQLNPVIASADLPNQNFWATLGSPNLSGQCGNFRTIGYWYQQFYNKDSGFLSKVKEPNLDSLIVIVQNMYLPQQFNFPQPGTQNSHLNYQYAENILQTQTSNMNLLLRKQLMATELNIASGKGFSDTSLNVLLGIIVQSAEYATIYSSQFTSAQLEFYKNLLDQINNIEVPC